MQTRVRNGVALILAFTAAAFCEDIYWFTQPAMASGMCAPQMVATFSSYPDLPLDAFVSGKLGVLKPTFARSYLVVSYRYLTNNPIDQAGRKAILQLWDKRLNRGVQDESIVPEVKAASRAESSDDEVDGLQSWLETRRLVPGAKALKDIDCWSTYRLNTTSYDSFVNCQNDGFLTATHSLKELIKKYGTNSKETKGWLVAQDQVFCNCGVDPARRDYKPGAPGPFLPAKLVGSEPMLIKKHRQYQLGCAYFYSSHFDEALKELEEIAADPESPWQKIAPYLQVRALIRKSCLQKRDKDPKVLARAQALCDRLYGDPSYAGMRDDIKKLRRILRCRQLKLPELSNLFQRDKGAALEEHLDDLTMTIDFALSESTVDGFKSIPPAILYDDLVDWVLTFSQTDDESYAHAVKKWKVRRTLPWLMACIAKATKGDAELPAILAEAAKLPSTSPGYLTASYHLVRLWLETQNVELARKRLDSILALPLSANTKNSFLEEQALVARSIGELINDCAIVPAGIIQGDQDVPEWFSNCKPPVKPPMMFNPASIDLLNSKLPLSLMRQIAMTQTLPRHLRTDALKAVWVRAVMLGNDSIAREVSVPLMKLLPQLSSSLLAYNVAKSPDERRFASTLAILKSPGLRPYFTQGTMRERSVEQMDVYSDNWWRNPQGDDSDEYYGTAADKLRRGQLPAPAAPLFATAVEKEQLEKELQSLSKLGCSANYLAKLSIDWSKRARQDPRVPEALHFAIKVTRYGGTDENTSALSKQAFQILKKNYPGNKWEKETKFYF